MTCSTNKDLLHLLQYTFDEQDVILLSLSTFSLGLTSISLESEVVVDFLKFNRQQSVFNRKYCTSIHITVRISQKNQQQNVEKTQQQVKHFLFLAVKFVIALI